MNKYINAYELINQLEEYRSNIDDDYADGKNKIIDVARILIAEMPTSDVEEVKHGEWIKDIANPKIQIIPITSEVVVGYHCSNCEKMIIDESEIKLHNFCPNCGADMRGTE